MAIRPEGRKLSIILPDDCAAPHLPMLQVSHKGDLS
jgi:hypothetical protein